MYAAMPGGNGTELRSPEKKDEGAKGARRKRLLGKTGTSHAMNVESITAVI